MICPCCGSSIYLGLRLRTFTDIPLYYGRCAGPCKTCFTFLPLFIAPRKWYLYYDIEKAISFVSSDRFVSISDAFASWDGGRDDRLDDGLPPGPRINTVLRWRKDIREIPISVIDNALVQLSDKTVTSQESKPDSTQTQIIDENLTIFTPATQKSDSDSPAQLANLPQEKLIKQLKIIHLLSVFIGNQFHK